MPVKIDSTCEIEVKFWYAVYRRIGKFERYWNTQGFPDGTCQEGTY